MPINWSQITHFLVDSPLRCYCVARQWRDRMAGCDTVVMITSDGLDVGAPDLLRHAMRELHRRSAGVVWLNPLLETEGYEPTASGMRAARPYVTTFTSVNDASGLARLSRTVRLRAEAAELFANLTVLEPGDISDGGTSAFRTPERITAIDLRPMKSGARSAAAEARSGR